MCSLKKNHHNNLKNIIYQEKYVTMEPSQLYDVQYIFNKLLELSNIVINMKISSKPPKFMQF